MTQRAFFAPDSPVPAGETPSWFTPLEYFFQRERELIDLGVLSGPYDCDPCGHPDAPVSREILRRGGVVYTVGEDGLHQPWAGRRPFVNPPFDADTIDAFAGRLHRELSSCRIREVSLHVPAWTDRGWWHDHIEPDRRRGKALAWFERGRLAYGWPGNPTATSGRSGTFPSALVTWGAR